jgi:hypothetical protein
MEKQNITISPAIPLVALTVLVILFAVFIARSPVWHPPQGEVPGVSPLAPGRQVYYVSTGGGGPKITEAVIDPLDAEKGEQQSFEVVVSHTSDVGVVAVELKTDTVSKAYPLSLVSGDTASGRWRGEWVLEDTHDHEYQAVVGVLGSDGATSSVTLSFR